MAGKSTKEMFGDVFGHNILILILISYICIYIHISIGLLFHLLIYILKLFMDMVRSSS